MELSITSGKLTVGLTTKGGTLISIKAGGLEYLWQGDPTVWSGQAPICFPICGSLRNNTATTLDGDTINLPRHGFARKQEFTLIDQTKDSATFALATTPILKEQYPFDFEFRSHYQIADATLTVTFEIINHGNKDLPFYIGGHPAFRCPLEIGKSYYDYQVTFEKEEPQSVPTPLAESGLIDVDRRMVAPQNNVTSPRKGRVVALSHELFAKAETIYDTLNSRQLEYSDKQHTHGIHLSFPEFPYLIIWSKPQADFVALEPWGGLSTCSDEDNVFEHKRGCLIAPPNESISRSFTINVF